MNDQHNTQPAIGITMGCPASIGPELIVKHHAARRPEDRRPLVVIGDPGVLRKISARLDLDIAISRWQPGRQAAPDSLNVLAASALDPDSFSFGEPTAHTAAAMACYVETAIELCLGGQLRAMVTGPISKTSLHRAGYRFPGHTELLAQRTGAAEVAMLLTGTSLRVVPATIHCALAEVAARLDTEQLIRQICLLDRALRSDFGLAPVRIAVAGLNPHAGEDGLFGDEERTIIEPAIARARELCHPDSMISGPHPPDTVFHKARAGMFDAVLAMYHDQGLIPFKLLHFDDGVNVTLGLPIVRTSVDHGTAYDIAGRGLARIDSLKAAVDLAVLIAANRARAAQG